MESPIIWLRIAPLFIRTFIAFMDVTDIKKDWRIQKLLELQSQVKDILNFSKASKQQQQQQQQQRQNLWKVQMPMSTNKRITMATLLIPC